MVIDKDVLARRRYLYQLYVCFFVRLDKYTADLKPTRVFEIKDSRIRFSVAKAEMQIRALDTLPICPADNLTEIAKEIRRQINPDDIFLRQTCILYLAAFDSIFIQGYQFFAKNIAKLEVQKILANLK